jgi:hypothetical protein
VFLRNNPYLQFETNKDMEAGLKSLCLPRDTLLTNPQFDGPGAQGRQSHCRVTAR